MEGIGGYLNAFTSEEMTCYHSKARHDRFDELLDVLTDMFLNSTFDPAEIDKERGVIKEELAMYLDQPQHRVQELLNETLWPRPAAGPPAHRHGENARRPQPRATGRLSAEQLRRQPHHHRRRRAVEASSRSCRPFRGCAERFPQGKRPQFVPAASRPERHRPSASSPRKPSKPRLALGIRACSRHDQRRYALRLLNTVLGENMSSRLFQVIREDRGLAYSIYSSLEFF